MNCGEKIAELRKKRGMTQDELGKAMNVSYQAVSKWERDESQPDFETMSKIAKLFNVPLGYFADGESETQVDAPAPEPAPQKVLIGTCTRCGRVVYEGEAGETSPKLLCGACSKQKRQEALAKQQAQEAKRKLEHERRVAQAKGKTCDVKLVIGAVIALALYILFTVLCFSCKADDLMLYALLLFIAPLAGFGIVFAVSGLISELRDNDDDEESYSLVTSMVTGACFAAVNLVVFLMVYLALDDNFYYLIILSAGSVVSFTFVSQYMWGGVVGEIFTCGGFTFKMPGFIFSLSVDSILWMIVTKVLLGFLSVLIFVATTIFFALVAMLGSVFLFIPSLLFQIGKRRKAIREA